MNLLLLLFDITYTFFLHTYIHLIFCPRGLTYILFIISASDISPRCLPLLPCALVLVYNFPVVNGETTRIYYTSIYYILLCIICSIASFWCLCSLAWFILIFGWPVYFSSSNSCCVYGSFCRKRLIPVPDTLWKKYTSYRKNFDWFWIRLVGAS